MGIYYMPNPYILCMSYSFNVHGCMHMPSCGTETINYNLLNPGILHQIKMCVKKTLNGKKISW